MSESTPGRLAARVKGDGAVAAILQRAGEAEGGVDAPLVLDAGSADPQSWADVENQLLDAFRLSREAMGAGAASVFVVNGEAAYGHAAPLRAALATALLGGVRSLAVEGQRKRIPAHAVTVARDGDPDVAAEAVRYLLGAGVPTGQLLHCDATHIGRPAV